MQVVSLHSHATLRAHHTVPLQFLCHNGMRRFLLANFVLQCRLFTIQLIHYDNEKCFYNFAPPTPTQNANLRSLKHRPLMLLVVRR
jgi:hypothetical protein